MRERLLLIVAAAMAVSAYAGAKMFEAFGYNPCALCLEQRWPYYIGIPLLFLSVSISKDFDRNSARKRAFSVVLFLSLSLFLYSAFLAGYHSGVEWKWWAGPKDCAVGLKSAASSAADLLDMIKNTPYVSCGEPSLRILGLSLAGWNFIVSLAISALLFATIRQQRQTNRAI